MFCLIRMGHLTLKAFSRSPVSTYANKDLVSGTIPSCCCANITFEAGYRTSVFQYINLHTWATFFDLFSVLFWVLICCLGTWTIYIFLQCLEFELTLFYCTCTCLNAPHPKEQQNIIVCSWQAGGSIICRTVLVML